MLINNTIFYKIIFSLKRKKEKAEAIQMDLVALYFQVQLFFLASNKSRFKYWIWHQTLLSVPLSRVKPEKTRSHLPSIIFPSQSLTRCSVFLCFCLSLSLHRSTPKKVNSFLTQPAPYYVNVFFFFYHPPLSHTHTHTRAASWDLKSCTKWLIWLLKPKSQMVHRPPSTRLAARKETISGN